MTARLPPSETRGRLLAATAAAYAFVLAADLVVPDGSAYRHDARTVTVLAAAAVFIASTARFAIGGDAGWMVDTARWAGTVAALGVAGGMVLAALAEAFGLGAPVTSGMRFEMVECYVCEAPWDAAGRALVAMIGGGSLAALLAVPVGAVSRSLSPPES
ncbi:MAG TPA: hypothetical protein VE913_03165 [Longimicrobium sp.]|nr:hypothetical protein [Longimicrobium sp.]